MATFSYCWTKPKASTVTVAGDPAEIWRTIKVSSITLGNATRLFAWMPMLSISTFPGPISG